MLFHWLVASVCLGVYTYREIVRTVRESFARHPSITNECTNYVIRVTKRARRIEQWSWLPNTSHVANFCLAFGCGDGNDGFGSRRLVCRITRKSKSILMDIVHLPFIRVFIDVWPKPLIELIFIHTLSECESMRKSFS